jgi:hypothetical protein
MNIFVLDECPITSAQMQCDKHIIKMPLETAQMLCAVWYRYGSGDRVPLTLGGTPYKETHKNHPCTLWAGNDAHNYDWLWRHGMELCFEYTRRYNNIHKCQSVIMDLTIDNVGFAFEHMSRQGTPHPQCMPDIYKEQDGFFPPEVATVRAYRQYYVHDKKDIAKWEKSRPMPDWYVNKKNKIRDEYMMNNKLDMLEEVV